MLIFSGVICACLAIVDFPYSTEVTGKVLNYVLLPNIHLKCVDFLKLQELFFPQERKHTQNLPKLFFYKYVNMLHHYCFTPRQ